MWPKYFIWQFFFISIIFSLFITSLSNTSGFYYLCFLDTRPILLCIHISRASILLPIFFSRFGYRRPQDSRVQLNSWTLKNTNSACYVKLLVDSGKRSIIITNVCVRPDTPSRSPLKNQAPYWQSSEDLYLLILFVRWISPKLIDRSTGVGYQAPESSYVNDVSLQLLLWMQPTFAAMHPDNECLFSRAVVIGVKCSRFWPRCTTLCVMFGNFPCCGHCY